MGFGIKTRIKRFVRTRLGLDKGCEQKPKKLQIWSIGMLVGDDPCGLVPADGITNPVLTADDVTDIAALFVADPFIVRKDGVWYMFFEVLNKSNQRGEIGLAVSDDGLAWQYRRIVLREPFHLSYPYVFEWQGDYYMIPESWRGGGGVQLYKAAAFPDQWVCMGSLLEGNRFADSSLFRHADKWWLFTETSDKVQSPLLRLFMAEELMGPWREHPMSPIVDSDPHVARPGGRVIAAGERIIRFTQDVYPVYGTRLHAFEILELTEATYRERQIGDGPVLTAGDTGWNSGGMHHLDAQRLESGGWHACVDGFQWRSASL
jgi:hypothetical protein